MRPCGRLKVFGIDDVIVGALGASATVASNQATNQTNMLIAQEANRFNAQQAALNRDFNTKAATDQWLRNAQAQQWSQDFNRAEAATARQFSEAEALKARDFSASEAQKARDYTTMMSNTAYQRQVADMKAAGINPIMAAYKGGGADTPSGAQAASSQASASQAHGGAASASAAQGTSTPGAVVAHMRPVMENVFASALEAARLGPTVRGLEQDVKTKQQDTELRESQVGQSKTQVAINHATADKLRSENDYVKQLTKNASEEKSRIGSVTPAYWADKVQSMLSPTMKQGLERVTNSAKNWVDMAIQGTQ